MKPYFSVYFQGAASVVLAALVFGTYSANASLIAFDMNGISPNGGGVYAPGVGFRFTIGTSPLHVDALSGALWVSDWNAGTSSSANLEAQDIRVKLWRSADQALLAEVSLKSNLITATSIPRLETPEEFRPWPTPLEIPNLADRPSNIPWCRRRQPDLWCSLGWLHCCATAAPSPEG